MMQWIYRALFVAACPLLVYYQIADDRTGIMIGLAVGVVLVAVEIALESISLLTVIFGMLGASAGIIISKLVDYVVYQVGNDELWQGWVKYSILRYFAFGMVGLMVSVRKFPELDTLDRDILAVSRKRGSDMRVVDTSAIIDGRIVDVCETGFLTGKIVIPRFVLNEVHTLADSPDKMTRAKGRRGLDMIARMQELPDTSVKIMDKDIPEIDEVDGKLVRLAKDLGAKVVTTDFNLNKVSTVEGVGCLNVNDLTIALKPVVLPGEKMSVFVMKEGKEREQGVGYLDDGTMVVVEEGKKLISKRVEVTVNSILQTSAGRMIFTRTEKEA